MRHGESVANVFDRARRGARGRRRPAVRARLGAGARAAAAALSGEGIEAIVASPMRRAQETAAGINEVLDLPVTTDDELFEVRQSDAFYDNLPDAAEHATLAWMPTVPPTRRPRARSRSPRSSAASARARARLEASGAERLLVVSHYGVLHFMLGLTMFRDEYGPEHLLPTNSRRAREHRHLDLHAPRRSGHRRHPVPRLGADHLERPRALVAAAMRPRPSGPPGRMPLLAAPAEGAAGRGRIRRPRLDVLNDRPGRRCGFPVDQGFLRDRIQPRRYSPGMEARAADPEAPAPESAAQAPGRRPPWAARRRSCSGSSARSATGAPPRSWPARRRGGSRATRSSAR